MRAGQGLAPLGTLARLRPFMTRVALATVWVWFALGEPAGALARASDSAAPARNASTTSASGRELPASGRDASPGVIDGMCGDAPDLSAVTGARTEVAHDDASVKPATVRSLALGEALVPPLQDTPIAWCLSPDDPRCAPRDAGSPSAPHFAQPQWNSTGSVELLDVRAIAAQTVARIWQLGAARPGYSGRVERPPR